MLLLFVIGTRPEAIKMAPVILEARRRASEKSLTVRVVSTGQHREMLRPILKLFDIVPDIDLDLMQPDQTLASLTSRAVEALDKVLATEKPDALFVQGDTTTAMAGALAAFYRRVDVAHVEAGLRTGDLNAPFPEELNRRVIGQLARWHLAPTQRAADALHAEQLPPAAMTGARVAVTGNTVIDALFFAREVLQRDPPQTDSLKAVRDWKSSTPSPRQSGKPVLVLVTGHRRENFGAPFESFCNGLLDIARAHPEALLLYPVHLNPNVRGPVERMLGRQENIRLTPPADYPEFVALMDMADLIITDSGGVQEEAPSLGIPVLVTRTVTERPEAVEAGSVLLVGPDRERLFAEAHRLLADRTARRAMAIARSPYGDGLASRRCISAVLGEEFRPFQAS